MSKMSQLAARLDEAAAIYGLQGYQEALERGFTVQTHRDGTAALKPPLDGLSEAHSAAHSAYLLERDTLLRRLTAQRDTLAMWRQTEAAQLLTDTINFIKRGEE